VVLCERVTSVLIGLPAGAVPKVRIKIDRGSGHLAYTENAALGQRLMTPPAREAVSQAGFTAVIFSKNELVGALPRALTAAEIIDALHGVEKLLAAMPRDVLGAYGVLRSDGVGDAVSRPGRSWWPRPGSSVSKSGDRGHMERCPETACRR
jgi:hypothetical protein